jgi:phosphatidylglycerophosphatase A
MIDKLKTARFIASGFSLGYFKKAPGTWTSAYTAAVSYLILYYLGYEVLILASFICAMIGLFAVDLCLKEETDKDPSWITIDEVVGQSLGLCCLFSANIFYLILGFVLFRLFDIFKPWPISWAEKAKGALGVMLDDVIAGIFTGIVIFLLQLYY